MWKGNNILKSFAIKIHNLTSNVIRPGAILNISSIRKEALPYFAGWIIISTWLYCFFFPNGSLLFLAKEMLTGYERISIYVWMIFCPIIAIFFKPSIYVSKTMYSTLIAIIVYICSIFFHVGPVELAFQIIIAVAASHISASCGFGFFMILNNTEKFYSMIITILLPKLIIFFQSLLVENHKGPFMLEYLSLCCLLSLFICSIYFFKDKEIIPCIGKKVNSKKIYLILIIVLIVLVYNDVIAPLTLVQMKITLERPLEKFYLVGIIAGLLITLILQKRFKVNIYIMLNISLAVLSVGFVVSTLTNGYMSAANISAVCFGVSYSIGIVNVYYFAGYMNKKFQNITIYRIGMLLCTFSYLLGFGAIYLFRNVPIISSAVSVCFIIAFFMISPILMKLLYTGEWIDDSYRQDVTYESNLRAKLKELRLSPKEIEVCELLLQGYTLRQSAAMIGISYSTVNTYCTNLYRKLDINSRTELILLFKQYIN